MLSILFAGSQNETSDRFDEFATFCRSLGGIVAEHHKILIAGTTVPNADHHVARGALDYLSSKPPSSDFPRITLYHTDGDETDKSVDQELYEQLLAEKPVCHVEDFESVNEKTLYRPAFQQAVRDCDVVMLIGGGEKSMQLVDIAIDHHKPVLGFTAFERAGKEANAELRRVYDLMGISKHASRVLRVKRIGDATAQSYLDLIALARATNPWAKKPISLRIAILVVTFVLLAGIWLWSMSMLDDHKPITANVQYFWVALACVAAGLVGSYFRFVQRLRSPSDILFFHAARMTVRGLFTGLAIAGFTRMVMETIYRGGGVSQEISFTPLAVLCSVLCLVLGAAGLVSLKAIDEFLGRLPH